MHFIHIYIYVKYDLEKKRCDRWWWLEAMQNEETIYFMCLVFVMACLRFQGNYHTVSDEEG